MAGGAALAFPRTQRELKKFGLIFPVFAHTSVKILGKNSLMKENNRKKVNRILEDVLELETAEREKFLNEISIEDDIRREVELLLAFEEEAEQSLNLSAVAFSGSFFEDEKSPLLGQKIGAFKIVRELGTGGMGAVFLAERADGKFVQKVALKLLKREMNTAALRRRFRHEREILASLEHPNIARLVDAGTTEDRIPFLAMEYIEGVPINDYCNKNNLDLNKRLDLFRKVCAAVDFAHRNLVVHRDLKPSNILVTEDGVPKLLDFGISKILSVDFQQINAATVTKLGVMTPAYASPEQLRKKSVTTATDIYSLGVILYELLSGHRPFEEKEDDLKEIYIAVAEKEPPPPSRISDFGFENSDLLNSREIEKNKNAKNATAKFSDKPTNRSEIETKPQSAVIPNPKSLRGDLDNIILKALKKEPERRYSSAENFAADIERHQKGLPVTARPDTFSYRAGKFIKRNNLTVAAAALVLLAVLGGVAATLWQAEQARKEAAKAKKINGFLQDVLNFSNPHWLSSNPEKNRNATISEAIDAAVNKLETDLKDEPEIQAEIRFTLGKTYVGQGRNQEAERQLRSALEKFSEIFGDESPQVMKTKVILGDSLFLQGDYQEAERQYLDSINYFRQNDAEDENPKKWLAIAANNLGLIRQNQGNFSEAQRLFSESLGLARTFDGADRWVKPIALANLGGLNISLGNLEKSLDHLTEAEKEMKDYSETPRLEDAGVQKLIGRVYKMAGDFAEAEKRLLESHRIFVANVGEDHQFTAQPLSELADVYFMQGKYTDAEKKVKEALSIQQKMLSENHWEVLFAKAVLGKILTETGRIEEGHKLLTETLKAQEKISKNPNYIVAETKFALAENLIDQKKYGEAVNLLKANYSELSTVTDPGHPTLVKSKNLLSITESEASGL